MIQAADSLTIADDVQPDLVLAEATGVAATSDLVGFFDAPQGAASFRVQANVCVVDSLNFTKVLPYLKAASAQVACADGIVINKSDLVDEPSQTRLSKLLAEMNPSAVQIQSQHGRVSWDFVRGLRHAPRHSDPIDAPPEHVSVCSLSGDRADGQTIQETIRRLGDKLLRLKGIVDLGSGPELVESVFGSFSRRPAAAGPVRFGTTVIGWKISAEELRTAFAPAFQPPRASLVDLQ